MRISIKKINEQWSISESNQEDGKFMGLSWDTLSEMLTGEERPFKLNEGEEITGFKISPHGFEIRIEQIIQHPKPVQD